MSALVEVADLSVAYRRDGRAVDALKSVNLSVAPGERFAVIGESGSGKSTLALAAAGLLPPTATVSGRLGWPSLGRAPQPGKDFGLVFQDPSASLNPVLTVGEQVAEVVRAHRGVGWRQAYDRAAELFAKVHLPEPREALKAFPHQLSGGQKQRVAIAAAIAADPALLIADEPTSALDTIVQAEIVALIDGIVTERGMALLFVTHDIALAAGIADRIAVFRDGLLVESGSAMAVIGAPREPYTRLLLEAARGGSPRVQTRVHA